LVANRGGWPYKAAEFCGLPPRRGGRSGANAGAQQAAPQRQRTDMEGIASLVPLILIFLIMYFLLIRPQQKKLKEHQAMVAALRRGDQVVTQGGLIGKVTKVKDEVGEIEVEIAPNVNVRVVRSTVSSVMNKTEPAKS
jgi:preprotein translocase subunit YajC